jgi:hypothetical protein
MVEEAREVVLTPSPLTKPLCQLLPTDGCLQATSQSKAVLQELIHDGPASGHRGDRMVSWDFVRIDSTC